MSKNIVEKLEIVEISLHLAVLLSITNKNLIEKRIIIGKEAIFFIRNSYKLPYSAYYAFSPNGLKIGHSQELVIIRMIS